MNIPFLTWALIVALLTVVFAIRLVRFAIHCAKRKHHFIEIGSEREVFFVPGDNIHPEDLDDYED